MELYVAGGRHGTLQTWQQTGVSSVHISSRYILQHSLKRTVNITRFIIINTIHGYPLLCSTVTAHLTTPHPFRVDSPSFPYFDNRFTATKLRFSWNPFLANLQQSYSSRSRFKVKCLKRHLKVTFQTRDIFLGFFFSRLLLYFYIQGVREKVAVRLQMVLEVMSTCVCRGLSPFNFIRKHSLQICS
jgi:hypothetical protein